LSRKRLLIVAHAPSSNTQALRDALLAGAGAPEIDDVEARALSAFEAGPEDILAADAIILLTPENLGYMSGALKDFFDRCYYPCLERTQGKPYALVIRAGSDGTGTRRGVETIVTGLRWRAIQEPLICRGEWRPEFVDQCRELGMLVAAGVEAGVF
jgi:multimeric flavodoxin WrbA